MGINNVTIEIHQHSSMHSTILLICLKERGELKIASHVFTGLREIIVTQSVNEKMNKLDQYFALKIC